MCSSFGLAHGDVLTVNVECVRWNLMAAAATFIIIISPHTYVSIHFIHLFRFFFFFVFCSVRISSSREFRVLCAHTHASARTAYERNNANERRDENGEIHKNYCCLTRRIAVTISLRTACHPPIYGRRREMNVGSLAECRIRYATKWICSFRRFSMISRRKSGQLQFPLTLRRRDNYA